mgnify:CR=1 FL=1
METRLQRILLNFKQSRYLGRYLALASLGFSLPASGEETLSVGNSSIGDLGLTPVIERREVKIAGIDTEDFEIGISGGLFSVEDFESNPLIDSRVAPACLAPTTRTSHFMISPSA